ncbi:MAG TPA: ABC transporter permease [Planctomycetota bacterium]|nr:ABC transporter permease [Planctomycetota bacterium]
MIAGIAKAQEWFEAACVGAGHAIDLAFRAALRLRLIGRKRREVMRQLVHVCLGSMPVVFITALFTGMIVSLQTGDTLQDFGQESSLGYIVTVGMCREMGPVFTALALAGLVGSTYAAEIGTMKVSEEIDALEVMSIDPVYYLVMPRIVALAISGVVLTVYADAIGIIGGALVAQARFGVDIGLFLKNGRDAVELADIYGGLLKALVFGITTAAVACSQGLRAGNGPAGVGQATLRAVVVSFIFVLAFDYILSWLL